MLHCLCRLLLLPSDLVFDVFIGSAFSREVFRSGNSSSSPILLCRLLLLLPSDLVLQFFRSADTSIKLKFEKLEFHMDNIAPAQHQNLSL